MTPTDIALVQDSFAKVAPAAPAVATLFYGRLFEQNPSLRTMFKSDLTEQGSKLMVMLGAVVKGLDVVQKIGATQVDRSDRPLTPVVMNKVTIERK